MKRISWILLCVLALSVPVLADDAFKPSADADRTNIPAEYKWSLQALFPDADQWEKAFAGARVKISGIGMCRGSFGKSAKETLQCLDNIYEIKRQFDELYAYAFQWWSVSMTDQRRQELREKAIGLAGVLSEAAAFVDPELMKIPLGRWDDMAKEESGLAAYGFHFKDLKRREKHLLDAEQEALIALTIPMREGPYSIMQAMTQDMDFPKIKDEQGNEVELNYASFSKYRGSKDRRVRKDAVKAFFSTLHHYRNTLGTSLATSVKGAMFEAKARGYDSSLHMSLDADNVPVAVYENLLATTAENLPRTLHRYVALRKKILGLDEMHYYDMYNPLFPKMAKEYSYDEGLKLMEESLKPMGGDYIAVLHAGARPGSGWADVYPNKGKKGGAYCNAAYGTHPFVFLNYMDELDDVFTTAHEYGHAMHFYLSSQAQPYPTADAPIFLAEIASTFHEELLLHHLLSKVTDKDERLILLSKRVENIRLTITRQTMFAEFEKLIHAEVESGGALTADRMHELYLGLVLKYFGPEFTVDEFDAAEWAYIPHFYYNFYVYKYSTGLMSAIVFSQRILDGKRGALQQYKNLLAAGGSDFPLTILEKSGIDFKQKEIVQSTYDLFAATLDEMEELL